MEKLFDDKERKENRYARHLEKPYKFYDSSAKPEFTAIREMLNDWFSRYPDSHKRFLKRDFQSQFEPAFFELFIHELFRQQGFTLTPHPNVPNSSKNPDFLAKKGEVEIYLEAKVATDKSNEERTLENKLGAIYDELQELRSPDYWIERKEIAFISNKQAKLSKIRAEMQKWLDETHLKWNPTYNDHDDFDREFYTYLDKDVKISLRLFPSAIEKDQPVASYVGGSYSGGCEEALTNALREKGSKYGLLDKPYLICINLPGVRYPREDEIYNTLFGCRHLLSDSYISDTAPFSTEMDGILANPSGPAFTQVSAFFLTRVFESNLHVAEHWLIEHPYSKNKLPFESLALSYGISGTIPMKKLPGKKISEIVSHKA